MSNLGCCGNTMAEQNVPAHLSTRTDEADCTRVAVVNNRKSNLLFNAQKIQKKPIISDISGHLSNNPTSSKHSSSANVLQSTSTSGKHLGYPEPVEIVSSIRVNYVYQPWRAILSLLNQCLTGKTSGSDKPRHPVLQMLWGIVTQTNVDHAELIWEEFTQGIQTFFSHKASHKAILKNPKKKVTPLLIPYGRFSKVIIYYLASNNNIHRRPDSAVHHTGDDYILGNLKFVPKGESVEVFGMAIPDPLITEAIQQSSYYPKYLEMVAKNTKKTPQESASVQSATKRATPKKPTTTTPVKQSKPAHSPTKKPSKRKLPQKVRKGKPTFQLVDEDDEAQQESIPHKKKKREGEGDDADLERAIKLSLDPAFLPQGRAPVGGVTIRDPVSETTSKLHEVVGKGKAVVTENKVIKLLLIHTDPLSRPEDDTSREGGSMKSSIHVGFRTNRKPLKAQRLWPGPDPEPMKEDQTGSDSRKLHVSLAGPNPEHMDDEFLATAYPKVHENLKLITDERVIDDKPEKQPTEDDQDKSKVREESESTIPDPDQTVTSTPPVIAPFTDVSSSKPSLLVTPPPINTEATTITTSLPEITPFIALQLRVARLEQEMSEVKKTHLSADVLASIRSQVPTLIEKNSVLPGPESVKNQESEKSPKEIIKAKKEQDDDDDEGPSAGSNQGRSTKRRRSDSAASGSAKPPPKADDQSSKKPRESEASASKQHPTLSSTGWQITDTREAGVDSSMHRSDPDSEHTEQSQMTVQSRMRKMTQIWKDTDNAPHSQVSTTDLDLEYLLTGDKERKIALSISKLKAARYLDFGLEELVPSLWVESEREYDISAVYGITHWWFRRKEFYINKHSESSDREAVRSQMRILSVISVKFPHWIDAMNQEMNALLKNVTWEIIDLPKGRKAIGNEVVYMRPPEDNFPLDNKVCRLKKSIYGLKQAPRQWNYKLTSTLTENGFSQSKFDYSLFTKSNKGVFLALLVYVDDIIITNNNLSKIEKFKVFLMYKFMIKDLGKLKYFLGIEVIDIDKDICLNQRKYVLDLLSEYGMLVCKPVNTPLLSKLVISNEATKSDHVLDNITDYQKLMGLGIHFVKTSRMFLNAFFDADWAKYVITRKSVTVDIEQVAVSSSLRFLEPKRTIESRAKRSSINLVRTQHPSETMVFHNEDGNPARANIKQALGYLKDGDGDGNSQHLRYQLMKLMQFLMGLDDSSMQIRSSILSREVLPDVRSSYATISSEESHSVACSNVSGSSQRSQASTFVSNVPNKNNFHRNNQNSNYRPRPNNINNNRQSGGSGLVCENCGFNGHTIDRFFKIIGYPADFEKKKFGQNQKNKGVSNNNSIGSSSSSCFSDEQMATLISLIKDNKIGKNVQANIAGTYLNQSFVFHKNFNKFFCSNANFKPKLVNYGKIVDSGTNQHMAYTDKDLDNVLDISYLKIKVGHPNGTKAFISKIGNFKLSNGLTLFDVMVIPEYCVTLTSVHKIAKENKNFVVFDERKCYFLNQDLNLKNVLGTGDQCEGLYYYNEQEPVMNVLKKSLNFDKPDNDVCCEVCQRSKQTREPFPLSDHVTSSLGELVHLDLLGPYRVASSEGFRYFLTVVDDYTRAV
ncbi:ribonuclease H-like domain-containing protein [Tanacetum coccineum]|uniref:Ribonuclease H-like domain-containing protein n=1 Tax=Tanacetum coccineum TaxID=301880 RepID=A0ABQ4X5Z0_9ASTR